MAKKKTTETKKPATDAEMLLLSLDPIMAAALDAYRGTTSRPQAAMLLLAKSLKLKGYEPRKRGRPATKSPSE